VAASPAELVAPLLTAGGLEVFSLRLATLDPGSLDPGSLDQPERERLGRLVRDQDRSGFLAAHVLLRQLLADRLGRRAEELRFTRRPCPRCGGDHGRPALADGDPTIEFSLARSAELVVVALAPVPVGVDVEALASGEEAEEVSALLHPLERDEVLRAGAAGRPEALARVWTRKEALLKAIGSGVADERLHSLYLGAGPEASAPAGWEIRDLAMPAGHAAAVAVASPSA
jgi:4'-phosphopantetheinyl transferase